MNQPAGGEDGSDSNGQHAFVARLGELHPLGQTPEAIRQLCKNIRSAIDGHHAFAGSIEQGTTELRLCFDDLLAYRSDGDAQFRCCCLQGAQTRNGLDSPQSIEMHLIEFIHIGKLQSTSEKLN